jgi:hypothetical protein
MLFVVTVEEKKKNGSTVGIGIEARSLVAANPRTNSRASTL